MHLRLGTIGSYSDHGYTENEMDALEVADIKAGICSQASGRMRWKKHPVVINNYTHITTVLQQEWRLWDDKREWHEWRDVPIVDVFDQPAL